VHSLSLATACMWALPSLLREANGVVAYGPRIRSRRGKTCSCSRIARSKSPGVGEVGAGVQRLGVIWATVAMRRATEFAVALNRPGSTTDGA
jgi:hypothetical protein